jgi:hypothetical protein
MNNLFKHIEGNHFKLNEDMVPIRKYRYIIRKIEEAENFQYIKNILVPYVVLVYNRNSPIQRQITNKNISMNLKKIKHKIGTINTSDVIYYSSSIKLTGNKRAHNTFRFITYKDESGKLSSGFNVGIWNMGGYTTLKDCIPKDSYMW